jgi:hypothetical protein
VSVFFVLSLSRVFADFQQILQKFLTVGSVPFLQPIRNCLLNHTALIRLVRSVKAFQLQPNRLKSRQLFGRQFNCIRHILPTAARYNRQCLLRRSVKGNGLLLHRLGILVVFVVRHHSPLVSLALSPTLYYRRVSKYDRRQCKAMGSTLLLPPFFSPTTVDFPANISTINVWHYNFQRENAFVSSARSDQPLQ